MHLRKKCFFRHVEAEEKPSKKSKKGAKGSVASLKESTFFVKSTSPVTENHYKNGYENCTYSININTSNEDNKHDTNYINKYNDANHDTRKLHL